MHEYTQNRTKKKPSSSCIFDIEMVDIWPSFDACIPYIVDPSLELSSSLGGDKLVTFKDKNISCNGCISNLILWIYREILVGILIQNIDRTKIDQNSWKYYEKL